MPRSGDHVGGQAVIEGVMMRNKDDVSVAVRKENEEIVTRKDSLPDLPSFLEWPILRGGVQLFIMLYFGMRSLIWSANKSIDEEEEELNMLEIIGTLSISLVFGLILFLGIPFFATEWLGVTGVWFDIVDGIFRLSMFLAYIYAISFMEDIKRIFQYHGAEHKTVNCYEAGEELVLDNIKKYSTIHNRCGTSFILIVLLISILVFTTLRTEIWYYKFLGRLLLIPVIGGVSYELLKLGDKFDSSFVFNILTAPGRWLQLITTSEPSDDMIEVAVEALNEVVE